MEFLKVMLMAVVQGIAEFLPISSSGHLSVLGQLFHFDPEANMRLNIILHAGTLLAIMVFYFSTLLQLLLEKSQRRVILLVIVGALPAGLAGLAMSKLGLDEFLVGNLWIPGFCFFLTALLLWRIGKRKIASADEVALEDLSFRQAFGIGLMQVVALLPGISRSGTTISGGLMCKLRGEDSARFSFLMAIPLIGGAAFVDLLKEIRGVENADAVTIPVFTLIAGFIVSAVVGYLSLLFLIKVLNRGRLSAFSPYLVAAGLLTLGLALYRQLAQAGVGQ